MLEENKMDTKLINTLNLAKETKFYFRYKKTLMRIINENDENQRIRRYIQEIPLITKDDILGHEQDLIPKNLRQRIILTCSSSGTTRGIGSLTYYTEYELGYFMKLSEKIHNNLTEKKISQNASILVIVPFTLTAIGIIVLMQMLHMKYNTGFIDSKTNPRKIIDIIRRLRPELIKTTPDIFYNLIEYSLKTHSNFRLADYKLHIQFTGNVISDSRKKQLNELLNVEISETFGVSEFGGPLGGMCVYDDGMHFYASEEMLVEIHSFDNKDVWLLHDLKDTIRGKLVATPLYRQGMIFLRYFTDDIVEVIPGRCPCGVPYPKLRFLGKIQDCFRRPKDGIIITPYDLENKLLDTDPSIWEFKLYVAERKKRGKLLVEYIDTPQISIGDLLGIISDYCGLKIVIEKKKLGRILRFKPKRRRIIKV